jgi:hypothetical protein
MSAKIFIGSAGSSTGFSTAGNYSPSGAPSTGDDWYANQTSVGGVSGSDESAVTLATLNVPMTMLYAVGDLGTPLKVGATLAYVGAPGNSSRAASGSGRVNLDFAAIQTNCTIFNSSSTSTDTGLEPVRIKGTHASNVLNVEGGRVGVATDKIGDTATLATINLSGGATLNLASGVTWTTINQSDGTLNINSAGSGTTLTQTSGTANTLGNYLLATMSISGTANIGHRKSSGNSITTLNLYRGGVADFSSSGTAIAVGTINVYGDCTIRTFGANRNHLSWTTLNIVAGTVKFQ